MSQHEDEIEGLEPLGGDEIGSDEWKQKAYEAILRDIVSEFESTRFNAVSLIEFFEGDPRLESLLSRLLAATDEHLVITALMAIGAWRHSNGATMIIDFLTELEHKPMLNARVEEEAILALGHVGGQEALEFLKNYALERFREHEAEEDALGMAAVEGVANSARRGAESAVRFLIDQTASNAWNFRESCADAFGIIFKGRESIPKIVYDTLMNLTKDPNQNVQIAAYMSLDEIVGLDEANRKILADARHKQIFGES